MDKKTLVKMTVPKLREEALKIEGVVGVHGMKKPELLDLLFGHFGIPIEKKKVQRDTTALKKKVKTLRTQREELRAAGELKKVKVLQKRIHNLKRYTRG